MHKIKSFLLTLVLTAGLVMPNLLPVQANFAVEDFPAPFQTNPENFPTRLVVGVRNRGIFGILGKPSAESLSRTMEEASAGVDATFVRRHGDYQIFDLRKSLTTLEYDRIAKLLSKMSGVVSVEQDLFITPLETIPNDPYLQGETRGYQYYLNKDSSENNTSGINALDAWDITTGDRNLRIAVLDTGIADHPDLDGRWVGGYDFVSNINISGDGDSWDADPHDTSYLAPFQGQGNWHGTHVTGIIGAQTNNGYGIAGLNWHSMIVPVRVLTGNGGSLTEAMVGLEWAAGLHIEGVPDNPNPAKIFNMSLGSDSTSCPFYVQSSIDKVYNAGGVIVISAGNKHMDARNSTPANCNHVIVVAASDSSDGTDIAYYSNYGSKITITSPGTFIYSTFASSSNNSVMPIIAEQAGTSMAAPHVTGVISLMRSVRPELNFEQIVSILQNTASPFL